MSPQERRAAVASAIGKTADDFAPDDLHAIANGGIMDPCKTYLPAGRLTEAEYRAREARILRGECA